MSSEQHRYTSFDGRAARFTVRPGGFNLSLDDGKVVLTVDGMGRPWTIWADDALWRRSYSGEVQKVWRSDDGVRKRIARSAATFAEQWEPLRRRLLVDALTLRRFAPTNAGLEAALPMDPSRLANDATRYNSLYGRLGILPPDAYMSVVLQLTEGCPFNDCAFCTFYRHRQYRVRPLDAFRQHVQAVKAYYGEALPWRPKLFLGDADCFAVADDRLMESLRVIREAFPERPIETFASSFSQPRRDQAALASFRALGLRRVTIGMETGSDVLLRELNKPGTVARALDLVRQLKSSEIVVSVVLLVGAGGARLADTHLDESVAALSGLPLGRGDRIYLSPLSLTDNSPYRAALCEAGNRLLRDDELLEQTRVFKERLRAVQPATVVTNYDVGHYLP